jgi:ribosomal protein S18 acetylase RimI-like enzyme
MPTSSSRSSPSRAPALRELRAADRAPLAALLRATDAFTEEEVGVALELIDAGLAGTPPRPDDYRFFVAELDAGSSPAVAGYVCYGLAPLSDGVYDLYWIAVDPQRQGRGVGRALLAAVEDDVRRRRGRTILIETGGKASYAPTRAFYEAAGYAELARIPDFFRAGDDKVTYARRVTAAAAPRAARPPRSPRR